MNHLPPLSNLLAHLANPIIFLAQRICASNLWYSLAENNCQDFTETLRQFLLDADEATPRIPTPTQTFLSKLHPKVAKAAVSLCDTRIPGPGLAGPCEEDRDYYTHLRDAAEAARAARKTESELIKRT